MGASLTSRDKYDITMTANQVIQAMTRIMDNVTQEDMELFIMAETMGARINEARGYLDKLERQVKEGLAR